MSGTVRENIREALLEGPATLKDLSRRVGIREHEVGDHLEHVERSLRHRGERLAREGPECLDCAFDFPRRTRFTRPAACPRCRSRRIRLPRFWIESR